MNQPKPIVPWMGGKGRLVSTILPLFPDHICYVELFAGGAAIFFAKPPSKSEHLNDINDELTNLYRVIKYHLEAFYAEFKWVLMGRRTYAIEQLKNPETLTDIQRASRFYYLQQLAFGAKVEGQTYGTSTTAGPGLSIFNMEARLTASWQRLAEANIESLTWQACLEKYDRPHTLFYADPPYWDTEGYGVQFPLSEYEQMAAYMTSMQGTMIVSVNDHPEMRRVFADHPMRSVPITYTVGGGGKSEETAELIIGNWRDGWPEPRPLTAQERLSF